MIVAATGVRKGLIIVNSDSSEVLYVGPDNTVTASNGIPVYPKTALTIAGFDEQYASNIWGITAANTVDTRFFQWGG